MPNRTRTSCLLLFSLLSASPEAGSAQSAGPQPKDIVMVTSGGVSQGAYLAGVNWAIVSTLRERRDEYRLAGVAGASAGNINSLLNVIEYCRADGTWLPEQSIFWNIWVPTGIGELLPDPPKRGPPHEKDGLFTRDFFAAKHFPAVLRALSESVRHDCTGGRGIPVGIAITKIVPTRYPVHGSSLSAVTQRVATAFLMSEATLPLPGPNSLVFLPPTHSLIDAAAGSFVYLPRDASGLISSDTIFTLLQASSAFPFAFAPLRMDYVGPGAGGVGPPECYSDTRMRCPTIGGEYFSDGGLFDNNPVDLAFRLYRSHAAMGGGGAVTRPTIIWADPDEVRGPMKKGSPAGSVEGEFQGIAALQRLLAGAVPTARQYELFAFARRQAEPQHKHDADLTVATRSFPIAGSYMAAFGGFLSRTLRELDFYIGIYDGLSLVASELVCGGLTDPTAAKQCTISEVQRLIAAGPDLSPAAETVAKVLLEAEHAPGFGRAVLPDPAPASADLTRARLFGRMADTLGRALPRRDPAACRDKDWVDDLTCADGFSAYLSVLDGVSDDVKAACAVAEVCSAGASKEFEELVKRPATQTARVLERALHQTARIERDKAEDGLKNHAALAQFGGWILVAPLNRHRRGVNRDPSSVPDLDALGWRGVVSRLFPYYLALPVTATAEVGYRPRLQIHPNVAAEANFVALRLSWPERHAVGGGRVLEWGLGGGAGVVVTPKSLLFSGQYLGLNVLAPYSFDLDPSFAAEIGAELINNKLRLIARGPVFEGARFWRINEWAFSVALQDLPGAAYWFLFR